MFARAPPAGPAALHCQRGSGPRWPSLAVAGPRWSSLAVAGPPWSSRVPPWPPLAAPGPPAPPLVYQLAGAPLRPALASTGLAARQRAGCIDFYRAAYTPLLAPLPVHMPTHMPCHRTPSRELPLWGSLRLDARRLVLPLPVVRLTTRRGLPWRPSCHCRACPVGGQVCPRPWILPSPRPLARPPARLWRPPSI